MHCIPSHCKLISKSDSPLLRRMIPYLNKIKYGSTARDNALDKVANEEDSAIIYHYAVREYHSGSTYITTCGRPSFRIVKENVITFAGGYLVPQGSPYLPRLNVLISLVFKADLNSKWENDLKFSLKVKNVYKMLNSNKVNKPVKMQHMKPVFLVWLVGIALSFVVVLIEVICKRYVCSLWIKINN